MWSACSTFMRIPGALPSLLVLTASLLCLPAMAQAPAQADRVVAVADASARLTISGHVPAWVGSARASDLGAVPDAQAISLMFGISRDPGVQAAFDQLLIDLQNPASPRYHHFLTPQQVGEQFGPTQHDLDSLTTWLTGQGFHVDNVTPGRMFVQATAPAAAVSAALGAPLHSFSMTVGGKSETLQAPTVEPTLPAALASIVATIGGLVDVPMHTDMKIMPPMLNTETNIRGAQALGQTNAVRPDMTLSGGTHFIAPADFTVLYDLAPVYGSGITGTGQKIMIIGGSRLFPQDISLWESDSALGAYTPNYIVPPTLTDPQTTEDDNMAEGTLDFERSYATAPGATIDMVIAANWLTGAVSNQLITYAITTVNDPILSMSFGSCEVNQGQANVLAENTLYAQAAVQGISVFASSGDAGVAACEEQGVTAPAVQTASISDICATGNVTCVGGTEFADTATPSAYWSSGNGTGYESALSYIPEGAWNEPTSTNSQGALIYVVAATGGGPSLYITKPTWQAGTGVPADGHRDVPDVAFSASLHNAYFACLNYSGASCVPNSQGQFTLTGFGGTSASTPSMAGIAALVDQKLGKRQGNLNPTLYAIAASTPAAFHDATPASSLIGSACTTATPSMCNNSNPSPTALTGGIAGYALTTGFDMNTGLGSLDVSKFINAAVAASSLLSATATVTATPSAISTAQTVVFKVTVASTTTGTPTGSVVFTSNGATLATVTLSGGTASTSALSFPTIGTYAIVATYSGDGTFAGVASSSYALVVSATGTTKSNAALTATATALTTAQTVGFSAAITGSGGTPTGTVQFTLDGNAYGVPVMLVGGVATQAPALISVGSHTVTCAYSGDGTFAASTCNTVTLSVTQSNIASTTSLSIVPTTITTTQSTTITVTVAGTNGNPTPTGTVTLQSGTTALAGGTLAGGVASGALSGFALGTYPIVAIYSGDNVYARSTSPVVTLTVINPTIGLVPTAGSIAQTAGGSSTDGVSVTSTNFSGTLTLACLATYTGSGAATDVPGCSFSPSLVNFSGTGTTPSTLTVSSTAASALVGGGVYKAENRRMDLTGLGGAAFAGLMLLCVPRRGRRTVNAVRLMAALLFLAAGLATLSGCGSGGSSGSTSNPGTTKGSYALTISATGSSVSYSTTINLTIQ